MKKLLIFAALTMTSSAALAQYNNPYGVPSGGPAAQAPQPYQDPSPPQVRRTPNGGFDMNNNGGGFSDRDDDTNARDSIGYPSR